VLLSNVLLVDFNGESGGFNFHIMLYSGMYGIRHRDLGYNLLIWWKGCAVLGVGFTGTLATSRPKRGDHRLYVMF
jgi:hypothetical protein